MRVLMIPLVLVVSLTIASCFKETAPVRQESTVITAPESDHKAESSARTLVDTCSNIQRDLSRSWQERQYWCAPERLKESREDVTRQSLLATGISTVNTLAQVSTSIYRNLKDDSKPSQGDRSVLNALKLMVVAPHTKSSPRPEAQQNVAYSAPVSSSRTNSSKPQPPATDALDLVWFAPNIEVLGPNGTQTATDIIPLVKNGNQRILLRGYASESADTKRSDLDHLAVGRAWSVRKLFEANGIDVNRITILYRDPQQDGRHVEVMTRG